MAAVRVIVGETKREVAKNLGTAGLTALLSWRLSFHKNLSILNYFGRLGLKGSTFLSLFAQ